MSVKSEVVVDGLRFPEGCRWHDGRLWFSDMHSGQVFNVAPNGSDLTEVLRVEDRPSGMAWLDDGSLIVSGMLSRKVYRLTPSGEVEVFADLSGATEYPINDLIRMPSGLILVGGFGYDLYADEEPKGGPLFAIRPDGSWYQLADDLTFPNGMVTLSSGTLVMAETFAGRLTAIELDERGKVGSRSVWAQLPEGAAPDGLTLAQNDTVWVSSILEGKFFRVRQGGDVIEYFDLDSRLAVDCELGGTDGRTLFMATANSWQPEETEVRLGRIEAFRVEEMPVESAQVSL